MRTFETEISAYLESIAAAKALGWACVGPVNGTPFWSSSSSRVDQQTRPPGEIMKFLLTSPIYRDKVFKEAYGK
jgi:hypothetical protein